MVYAISARLARLARRTRSRLATPFEYAAWHGWQTRQVSPGSWEFRDPRFGQRIAAHLTAAGEVPARHPWAQAAIAQRIHRLGTPGEDVTGRGA